LVIYESYSTIIIILFRNVIFLHNLAVYLHNKIQRLSCHMITYYENLRNNLLTIIANYIKKHIISSYSFLIIANVILFVKLIVNLEIDFRGIFLQIAYLCSI